MKKVKFMALLGISGVLFFGGVAYALTSVEVVNNFETGIVDISLSEYSIVNGEETEWVDNPVIMPADKISKIPRISNQGNECYVRAKLTFRGIPEISESNLYGIGENWFKADDGYYYYREVLGEGDAVDLFKGVNIPEDLPQEYEGRSFNIDIEADAVQSKNFTPSFNSPAPWGNVEILKCEKEGKYDINYFKKPDNNGFEIVYQSDSGKLIKNSDDFFKNFPYMMPGDTYSDEVSIENSSSNSIKLYFRSEAEDESELLDKVLLTISTEIEGKREVVYEGNLRAVELSKDVILGEIGSNGTGKFKFEISVPAELNNKYSFENSYVKWVFSTEPIKNTKPSGTGRSAKTGDSFKLGLCLSMIGLSVGVMAIIGKARGGKKQ